jgi:hypothetical protein
VNREPRVRYNTLLAKSGKVMQVENNLYYQFLMDNGNNFHVAVFYK